MRKKCVNENCLSLTSGQKKWRTVFCSGGKNKRKQQVPTCTNLMRRCKFVEWLMLVIKLNIDVCTNKWKVFFILKLWLDWESCEIEWQWCRSMAEMFLEKRWKKIFWSYVLEHESVKQLFKISNLTFQWKLIKSSFWHQDENLLKWQKEKQK